MTLPPAMDRRDVLKLASAAAIALVAPAGLTTIATTPRGSATSMIVLADPRYSESVRFAASLEPCGAKVIPLASDRAGLWFGAVEPQLSSGLRTLAGLTLESDLFTFERLAGGSGARTDYMGSHDWRCGQDLAHRLSGSIELDPIATALFNGKGGWAESLGQALGIAKSGGREERRLALNCPTQGAHGPRFFVSWLMSWTA